MPQNESIFTIVDNTKVVKILTIRCLGGSGRRHCGIGDLVVGTAKEVKPNSEYKKGSIVLALVVATRKPFRRNNGTVVRYSKNCAIIVKKDDKKNYKVMGSRVSIPLVSELDRPEFKDLLSLAPSTV